MSVKSGPRQRWLFERICAKRGCEAPADLFSMLCAHHETEEIEQIVRIITKVPR